MTEEHNTPYFIVAKDMLDDGLSKLKKALDINWSNYIVGYSYKTNALPWVIEYFRDNGSYAEVVSDDEYCLARSVNINPKHVIYNGVAKSKDTFLEAVRNHAIVNIDAEYEIDWLDELSDNRADIGRPYEVGIRVNFDLEKMCPGQTPCGIEGSRFGFCYENGELKWAIDRIESKGVRLRGIHLHKSSVTRMPNIYEAIARMAVDIATDYDLNLKYVDIGGGFFGGLDTKPSFDEYFERIRRILLERFQPNDTALIVEPGMALIGPVVSYVTTVLDVKKTTRSIFVVTDGSRTQIDPLMKKTEYFYDIIKIPGKDREVLKEQVISGYTCMENDRLFKLNDAEELFPGDHIIYHKVGAYTMCLSPLFIKWFPDVYLKNGTKLQKARNKWTENEYKSGSIVE